MFLGPRETNIAFALSPAGTFLLVRCGEAAELQDLLFFWRLMTQLAALGCISRHFADIKTGLPAKYILFPGARPMHLRLLCNATRRESQR